MPVNPSAPPTTRDRRCAASESEQGVPAPPGRFPCVVAVGGIGGSGTRVLALLLERLGLYMGHDINEDSDNLWFTLLFKRPAWYRACVEQDADRIRRTFRVFARAMTGEIGSDPDDRPYLLQAARDIARHGHDPFLRRDAGPIWPAVRLWRLWRARRADRSSFRGWGWKEPNTHLYLDFIRELFPGIRYVHMLRHGLDMAFSRNQNQLHNWGFLHGIPPPESPADLPVASLRYWLAANERALADGRRLFGERFHIVRFEEICTQPEKEIETLVRFLGRDPAAEDMAALAAIPRLPRSSGRYRERDLNVFPAEDLGRLEALGYAV